MRLSDRYKNVSTLAWSCSTRMVTTPNIAAPVSWWPSLGLLTRSRGGAWPRDAAADTHKQAGSQSTALTRAFSCSGHVTKRFRILATLK